MELNQKQFAIFKGILMNFLMVFDFLTQFWLDGRPGNEYFQISHKICDLLTPLTPLGMHPQCLLKMNLKQIEAIPPSVH